MRYAVIEDSGKQFKVHENDTIRVDLREFPEGTEQIEFDKVLLIGDDQQQGATRVGQPWLEGARVVGQLEGEFKDHKIDVVRFERRKGIYRKQGHRQRYLQVKIDKIVA